MSRIGDDSFRGDPVFQLRAVHHAARRSIAQFEQRGPVNSAPEALADSFLRGDLESLARVTSARPEGPDLAGSLHGVAGLLSELNGVLAYAATLGDGLSDEQKAAIQQRVSAIVGTIERLSGTSVPTGDAGARDAARQIRDGLLAMLEPSIGVFDAPG